MLTFNINSKFLYALFVKLGQQDIENIRNPFMPDRENTI